MCVGVRVWGGVIAHMLMDYCTYLSLPLPCQISLVWRGKYQENNREKGRRIAQRSNERCCSSVDSLREGALTLQGLGSHLP